MIFLVVFIVTLYLFPYIARFENTLKNSFRNSLMISIASFPYTILLLVSTFAIIGLPGFFLALHHLVLVWLFFGFALLAFIQSFILRRVFVRYEPKDNIPTDSLKEEDVSA